ncbi:hypothetical protein E2C01_049734 [Portunus trituberculatus]|uniref:Uncharacterized protein n=1 Tax=Portunus trituberculatus TaxID=210409 RepID=A0A5B7G6D6_PORTR|nr:hypothetical protein [Portunus trituberculatus]
MPAHAAGPTQLSAYPARGAAQEICHEFLSVLSEPVNSSEAKSHTPPARPPSPWQPSTLRPRPTTHKVTPCHSHALPLPEIENSSLTRESCVRFMVVYS